MYPEVIVAHVHLAFPAHIDPGIIQRNARRMSKTHGCSCEVEIQVNACDECGDIESVDITHSSRCHVIVARKARFN